MPAVCTPIEGDADRALGVLSQLRTLTARQGNDLAAVLEDSRLDWAVADAAFDAQLELHQVDGDTIYADSFELGVALDDISVTDRDEPIPGRVVTVLTTCATAIMYPQCASAAGSGVYGLLVDDVLTAVGQTVGE